MRKVLRKTTSTDPTVEEVLRNKAKTLEEKLDQSINYREAIEGPGTFPIDPLAIKTVIEIVIRNNLRSRQIS